MTRFLGGLLDLLVAHPYLLLVSFAIGWALTRFHWPVRRGLKAGGRSRRTRSAISGVMWLAGIAILLVAVGFLIPVGIMLLSDRD